MSIFISIAIKLWNFLIYEQKDITKTRISRLYVLDIERFISKAVKRELYLPGCLNQTFISNDNLPEDMNVDAKYLDSLLDKRFGLGFYFDMQNSFFGNTTYNLILNEKEYSVNRKHSLADIKKTIPDLRRLLNQNRRQRGIQKPCNLTFLDEPTPTLVLDAIEEKSIRYEDHNLQLSEYEFAIGLDEEGKHIKSTIDNRLLFSWLVIGSSGSGKTTLLHVILKSLLDSTDNMDMIICEPAKNELEPYLNNSKVSQYLNDTKSLLECLKTLLKRLQDKTDDSKIVLVIDEFPAILASKQSSKILTLLNKLAAAYAAKGFVLFIFSQQIRAKYIPGDLLQNIKAFIIGQNADSQICNNRIGVNKEQIDSLSGFGDFVLKTYEVETRIRSYFFEV